MEETTSVNSLRPLEDTRREPGEVNKFLLSLIALLLALLTLKQKAGMASIDERNIVRISITLTFYGGAVLCSAYILEARPNSNWGKFISTLSHLFGALTCILVLVILLPALEIPALLFWIICFVSFISVSSYPYLKTLFTGAVRAFIKLHEYIKNIWTGLA